MRGAPAAVLTMNAPEDLYLTMAQKVPRSTGKTHTVKIG
jgi:hypothetical protein